MNGQLFLRKSEVSIPSLRRESPAYAPLINLDRLIIFHPDALEHADLSFSSARRTISWERNAYIDAHDVNFLTLLRPLRIKEHGASAAATELMQIPLWPKSIRLECFLAARDVHMLALRWWRQCDLVLDGAAVTKRIVSRVAFEASKGASFRMFAALMLTRFFCKEEVDLVGQAFPQQAILEQSHIGMALAHTSMISIKSNQHRPGPPYKEKQHARTYISDHPPPQRDHHTNKTTRLLLAPDPASHPRMFHRFRPWQRDTPPRHPPRPPPYAHLSHPIPPARLPPGYKPGTPPSPTSVRHTSAPAGRAPDDSRCPSETPIGAPGDEGRTADERREATEDGTGCATG
ncbi:hypothetical protein PMIN01_03489 [Paraphaeosphaeria minitans]|uniref:Uncharacterized protein n=1 Tax=Paraphaeosphaeria minitans TaxID=565426 RepID=A0A9P6KTR3_9PLEO|nr:hypothetical protein PMIN01_03489 [Paraphaeosphaeria minitans]